MSPLKIATWNVNGIRAREAQFLEWVERERPDAVCLQELKSTVDQVPPSICELQGYRCHWHGARLVICGDINITRSERDVHPKERNPDLVGQRPDEREIFERLLAQGLVDVGRALDPDNENLFTWWAPWRRMRERNIGWRLDYILASESLASKATQCSVYREIGTSDHAPVVAIFDLNGEAPSRVNEG